MAETTMAAGVGTIGSAGACATAPAGTASHFRELKAMLAGFGGQGILFAGKLMAYAGLIEGREVSWLPSYGPEMRGGTANCSVCLSDDPIGSPLVLNPNALVAMNQPSLDKFVTTVGTGGVIVVDSTMVPDDSKVRALPNVGLSSLPASAMAEESGLKGLANIICVGRLWAETNFCARETLDAALERCVPPRKAKLLEPNRRALRLGSGEETL